MVRKDYTLKRKYLANPLYQTSVEDKLKNNKSTNLKNGNRKVVDFDNGYIELQAVDTNKKF
ncbi:hypothetical protein [Salsuginibacillus kocurii]|uniref:hypothetical protein n=1 Tax=Salsuginibacillus kocurii TaxID=427078 RepID=UPI00037BB602|nr:hypothetical protein [Salsuginibacillus kocurii]